MLVITPHMTGQKPLHESAQRLVMRSFNHKVKMIRHQASGKFTDLFWDVRHRVLADFNVLNGAQRLNPSIDSGQASGTFGTGASQNSPELYERSSRDHFLG
jgi:hypothetical protein